MYIEPNPTFEEIEEEIRVSDMVEEAMNEAENSIIQINYTGTLIHKWFSEDSLTQKIVNYAYKLGGMDFVYVLECENWSYRLNSRGDNGHAHWICQMNDRYHKDIPSDYTTNRVVAVEYCYKKWKSWVAFYWPSRIIKGKKCYNYVSDRFTIIE